jgi:predicted DNA-binding protein with PD1-like motif
MKKLLTLLLLVCIFNACKSSKKMATTQNTSVHAFRLKPGLDLRKEIEAYVKENNISARWIATCVGSLTNYNIRFANQKDGNTGTGHFEIVSLTGTVSTNGSHLHISVSDSTGSTIGGHLLQGNIVYTTAEIVIQSAPNLIFKREKDGSTPWEELQVEKK